MKLKYTFEMIEMDNDLIAVPTGKDVDQFSGIIKLNDSASEIFKLLNEEITEEEIILSLMKTYDASREEIADEVHNYLAQLKNDGLLD